MSFIKLECQSFKWARFGTIAYLYCYLHQCSCFGLRQSLVGVAANGRRCTENRIWKKLFSQNKIYQATFPRTCLSCEDNKLPIHKMRLKPLRGTPGNNRTRVLTQRRTKMDPGSPRSKRFRAVQEQRTRNESQRPRKKWRSKRAGRGWRYCVKIGVWSGRLLAKFKISLIFNFFVQSFIKKYYISGPQQKVFFYKTIKSKSQQNVVFQGLYIYIKCQQVHSNKPMSGAGSPSSDLDQYN